MFYEKGKQIPWTDLKQSHSKERKCNMCYFYVEKYTYYIYVYYLLV